MFFAKRPARSRVAVTAAALALSLTGCASDTEPDPPAASETPTASSTPTPSATATPTPTPTADPTTEPTAAPALTLKQRLLPTSSVPGLNAAWTWQDGKTRRPGTTPFGICASADLGSIGATEVVERTWYPPDDSDDNAAQQVATFADAKSAAQAWSVLASWRTSCGERVSSDIGLNARPMTAVTVPDGQARWYLVSWEPVGDETGRFEALGMVRNGTTLTVLRMTNSGQDYNYPAGKEPMVGMVRAAAALLAK